MSRLKVVAHRKSGQIIKGFAELAVPVNEHGIPETGSSRCRRRSRFTPQSTEETSASPPIR
jgi:hypothetical protein